MTEQSVYFIVDGPVVVKKRPKFSSKNGVFRTYTPKKTQDYEKKVREAYLREYPTGMAFEDGPVEMILNVYMAVPKSYSAKKRSHMICFEYPTLHKGDADNFLKSVADALNGVAYTDDCQIVIATVNKLWSEEDRAEITLRRVSK